MKTLQTTAQYETTERNAFRHQLIRIESLPLNERREGASDFAQSLSPERMAERADWILNGSYGFGCQLVAKEIAASPRMNRAAWFGQVIAALDHNCPAAMARKAFLSLPTDKQDEINKAIISAISLY